MKVRVNWGKRDSSANFRVNGSNLEEAYESLNAREEWGKFSGTLTHKWTGDAEGNAKIVTLSPSYTITMPVWPGYRKQPQKCKDAWDAMYRALKKHEEGHREIFEQGVAALTRELEELEATGAEVDRLAAEARDGIQDKHDAYDRETDHGRSRGVEIVLEEGCRRKK